MASEKKVTPNLTAPDIPVEEVKEAPAPVKAKAAPKKDKVKLMIPIDPINPGVDHWWCCINGQEYYVARGKTVEVRPEVAALYHRSVEGEQKVRGMIKVKEIGSM